MGGLLARHCVLFVLCNIKNRRCTSHLVPSLDIVFDSEADSETGAKGHSYSYHLQTGMTSQHVKIPTSTNG